MKELLKKWHIFVLMSWIAGWVAVNLWPSWYWLEVHQIRVFNAEENQPIFMAVDKIVHRHFFAQWTVRVRQIEKESWTPICSAIGAGEYEPSSRLPATLDLKWWTNGKCETLPLGQYLVNTTWTIYGGWLPNKHVSVDSNIFQVVEAVELAVNN